MTSQDPAPCSDDCRRLRRRRCAPVAGATPEQIEWSIQRDGSSADASRVQLTIESRWGRNSRSTWSNDRAIGDLQGLSPAQVTGARGTGALRAGA